MKDLNKQSLNTLRTDLLTKELSKRKHALKQVYLSRKPHSDAAVYAYRCLPKETKEKLEREFAVIINEKARKEEIERCLDECMTIEGDVGDPYR